MYNDMARKAQRIVDSLNELDKPTLPEFEKLQIALIREQAQELRNEAMRRSRKNRHPVVTREFINRQVIPKRA